LPPVSLILPVVLVFIWSYLLTGSNFAVTSQNEKTTLLGKTKQE
jgi:hypothetical protein